MAYSALLNRLPEQQALETGLANTPQLVIVKGRRRIGKSFLLQHAIRNRRGLYFQASQESEQMLLDKIGAAMAAQISDLSFAPRLPNWEEAFSVFTNLAAEAPLTLIFDEFQWLVASNPALPSICQKHWDQWNRDDTAINLVLCGSAISFMEGLLDASAPLHGRATTRLDIHPFTYKDARLFDKTLAPTRSIERFSVLGGVPQYHAWAGQGAAETVIREKMTDQNSPLFDEPSHLIRAEDGVRDPSRYLSCLAAVAGGKTKLHEIADRVALDPSQTRRYLGTLHELRYLQQEIPTSQKAKDKKRSIWVVDDPFINFWFTNIDTAQSQILRGRQSTVADRLVRRLPELTGPVFEQVCRQWVGIYSEWPEAVRSDDIGRWWSRDGQVEIDIACQDNNGYTVLGSCKWHNQAVGKSAAIDLLKAKQHLGLPAAKARVALFVKERFTKGLKEICDQENIDLLTAKELFR